MSASKIKHEFRTIIDLNHSNRNLTKHKIYKMIKEVNVVLQEQGIYPTYIDNQINIGVYTIRLILNRNCAKCDSPNKLKDYGNFSIKIYENYKTGLLELDINKYSLFKEQNWIRKNQEDSLCIKDLISAILFCNRLDRLKIFN